MRWRRALVAVLVLALAGAAVWYLTGGPQRLAERRVEAALIAQGLPEQLAQCIGGELSQRLSLLQMRKLERLAPQEGEPRVPLSLAGLLERLRRVDDPEVVDAALAVSAICALREGI